MSFVIKIIGPAGGFASEHDGRYLMFYDADIGARGLIKSTAEITEAMKFSDAGAALQCWKRQNIAVPKRADGKPNRPLTAFTVQLVRY